MQWDIRVDGSEMSLDPANFLLKDLVPETSLEFTLSERGSRDTHSLLTTTKKHLLCTRQQIFTKDGQKTDIRPVWCDCSTVERRFRRECFDDHECLCVMYLSKQSLYQKTQTFAKHRHTRADLSLLLVMQYVLSGLSCKSVTTSLCARSLLSISSPVLTLKRATLPDSWPVTMMFGCAVKAQTVAFDPIGLNMCAGSFDSV